MTLLLLAGACTRDSDEGPAGSVQHTGVPGAEMGENDAAPRSAENEHSIRDDPVEPTTGDGRAVKAQVIGEDGLTMGSIVLESVDGAGAGVNISLEIHGLEPGLHAVHLHARGRCDAPGFFTAGGHFDPAGNRHGKPDDDQDFRDSDHHAGDMLNQEVDSEGDLIAEIVNLSVSLAEGPNELLDRDGTALVVYANADDYETQPIGSAGRRVACAEITAPSG